MKSVLVPAAVLAAAVACNAHAGLAQLNATCPGNLEVHADAGGPVYINGKQAALKRSNDNYYEARDAASGVTVSISNNPDGSTDVSYTGRNRVHGVCQLASAGGGSAPLPAPARENHPAAEEACLAAVAAKVGVGSSGLSVIEALGGEAGISVTVTVKGADAPWACMTNQEGKPWNVSYTGSEGKL